MVIVMYSNTDDEADLFRSFFEVRILEYILQLDLFRHGAISGRHCSEIAPPKSRSKGKFLEEMAKWTSTHGREGEPCFKMSVCIYATEHRSSRSTHQERAQQVRKRQWSTARRNSWCCVVDELKKNISKQFFSSRVYLRSHSNDQDSNVPTEIRITAAEVVPLAGRSEHPQTGLAWVHTSSLFLRISSHQNFFSFLNTQALVLLDKSQGDVFIFSLMVSEELYFALFSHLYMII